MFDFGIVHARRYSHGWLVYFECRSRIWLLDYPDAGQSYGVWLR
jgi:hypothetical protein